MRSACGSFIYVADSDGEGACDDDEKKNDSISCYDD